MNFHLRFLQYKCERRCVGETGRGEVCGLITPKTWSRTLYVIGFIYSYLYSLQQPQEVPLANSIYRSGKLRPARFRLACGQPASTSLNFHHISLLPHSLAEISGLSSCPVATVAGYRAGGFGWLFTRKSTSAEEEAEPITFHKG